jgi:signal transduction histidine kinase
MKNKDEEMAGRLDEIQNLTQETIQDLRPVTYALRPLYLDDLGLVAALDTLTREMQDSAAIPLTFQHLSTERRLPSETKLPLYHIGNIAYTPYRKIALLKIDQHAYYA